MSSAPKKIQKLRTFRGDMEAVRAPVAATPTQAAPKIEQAVVRSDLPPVLNTKKEAAILPPLSKSTTAVTPVAKPVPPEPTKPPTGANLESDISLMLGSTPKPKPAVKEESLVPPAPKPLITPARAISASAISKEPVAVMETSHHDDMGGTVITNQKRGRFKLLPSMWEAVKLWFSETEKALARRAEKRRQAIPTVRTLEERQATVKKAASAAALSPKDDYAKLAKKLPPQKPTTAAAPVIKIAKKEEAPAPSWGHYESAPEKTEIKVEKVPLVQPEPIKTIPVITVVSETTSVPQPPVAVPAPPPVPTPAPVIPPPTPLPVPVPPPTPEPVVITPPPPKPPKRPNVEPVRINVGAVTAPAVRPRAPMAAPKPVPPPVTPQPAVVRKASPTYTAPRQPRNFKWLFYVGVVATALVAMVGGAALVNSLFGGNTDTPVTSTNLPNIVATPIREDGMTKIILTRDRASWYEDVKARSGSSVVTIAPVINIGGAESAATTEQVLSTLAWRLEPTFLRSIKEITFIMAADKPAIVMKVTSFDSAFGGLLVSERNLSGELTPLFGTEVTSTYKIGVGTVAPEFIDELANNHDVRVLNDETETERLVYGFTDQNTLIIAPDKETFTLIVDRLR